MHEGRIVLSGKPEAVFEHADELKVLGLESP